VDRRADVSVRTPNHSDPSHDLRIAQHRLEQIFLSSPLALIEADSHGAIVRWSPAAERIFGWAAAEAIGRNAIELLVPGAAREHVQGVVAALLSGQAASSRNENRTRDGRAILCRWHNAVLRDEAGAVTGWLSQVEDITEQTLAAARIAESERYQKMIFGAMSDIVLVFDADGIYRDVAPTQPELRYGHSRNLLNKSVHEVAPPESADEFLAIIRDVLATGAVRQHTYSFPGPEGTQTFTATVSRISADRALWVARDVTAERAAQAELAELQDQIIAAQQAALRELSTPIIPLSEGVIAMPLIGAIDSARAQQVLEALLSGVAEQRARAAILDITGVQVVDTQVANALLRAAQAVKLLGAQVIITGIRPEVAQTLVGLGLDLGDITTLATLQSGIAHALGRR
jgi:rsbT co-antagonist protein RsbR